jgi:hypothetical protein
MSAQAGVDPRTTPAMDKFVMFRSYQRYYFVYVFASVSLLIFANFVPLRRWIAVMLSEALELILLGQSLKKTKEYGTFILIFMF